MSPRESGVVVVHGVGGLVLSSVMRGSKAPGSKYLPRILSQQEQSSSFVSFETSFEDSKLTKEDDFRSDKTGLSDSATPGPLHFLIALQNACLQHAPKDRPSVDELLRYAKEARALFMQEQQVAAMRLCFRGGKLRRMSSTFLC